MPVPPLPPMTTRQAKRKNQKNPVKFKYTASQMRRADRIDELEERRRGLEDKDRKRKVNKRKREEQDAKDRALQQKLLNDGKISVEDTWGKVTASQPRLNSFFMKKTTRKDATTEPTHHAIDKENRPPGVQVEEDFLAKKPAEPAYDSQEHTLVEKSKILDPGRAEDDFTDEDFLHLLSPLPVETISGPDSPAQLHRSPIHHLQTTPRVLNASDAAIARTPSDPKSQPLKPIPTPIMPSQKRKMVEASIGTDSAGPSTTDQLSKRARIQQARYDTTEADIGNVHKPEEIIQVYKGKTPARPSISSQSLPSELRDMSKAILNNPSTNEESCDESPSPCPKSRNSQPSNMDFGDDGIDDDTLAAILDPTTSRAARSSRRSSRFVDMSVPPVKMGSLTPIATRQNVAFFSNTQSFVSVEDDVFFAAENNVAGAHQEFISTQDALDEAFESVEQEAALAAAPGGEDEDMEMEDD